MKRHQTSSKFPTMTARRALAILVVVVSTAGCHSSMQLRHEVARSTDFPAYAAHGIDQVLSSHNSSAPRADGGLPDDGLNGEYSYAKDQPVSDLLAYDGLPGPQLAKKEGIWPSPGPSPVFDTMPAIDISWLANRGQQQPASVID